MLLILNGRICLRICNIIANGTPIFTVIARETPVPTVIANGTQCNEAICQIEGQIASAPTLFSTLGFAMTLIMSNDANHKPCTNENT